MERTRDAAREKRQRRIIAGQPPSPQGPDLSLPYRNLQ